MCAIYTRKSTSIGLERDFNSLDAQREACERYIAARAYEGWQLVPERYDDGGFSGANVDRPAFQRLLEDIDAGKVDVLVVYKVDRLSRSLLDFSQVMDRFNRAGAAFVSVTQNFSTADAMGRLTLNMLMSFAEFEREMIAERTRDKIAAARRKGKWTGGPIPLGYDVVDRKLVINDLEAVVIRELFFLYEQHRSALVVARLLNQAGRITKSHRAENGNVRVGKKWSKDAVLRVLRNPVYGGLMPCHGELHEGEHQSLIDRERYLHVRSMLDSRRGAGRDRGLNPVYLLRGILHCARCRMAMTPASTRKRGKEYRYYRCVTRDKQGRALCDSQPLSADAIEEFVVKRMRAVASDGSLAADVERRLVARSEHRRKELETERRGLPAQIARLSSEGQRLVEKVGDVEGAASSILGNRITEVFDELGLCERRLAKVERALAEFDRVELEKLWVVRALADFDTVWDVLSIENQARLVRALVCRVDVDEPKGVVTAILADIGIDDLGPDRDDEDLDETSDEHCEPAPMEAQA